MHGLRPNRQHRTSWAKGYGPNRDGAIAKHFGSGGPRTFSTSQVTELLPRRIPFAPNLVSVTSAVYNKGEGFGPRRMSHTSAPKQESQMGSALGK